MFVHSYATARFLFLGSHAVKLLTHVPLLIQVMNLRCVDKARLMQAILPMQID